MGRVISETLLSKILLGTLACAPAYNEFLKEGLKKANISQLSFSEKSLERIVEENIKNIPVLRECESIWDDTDNAECLIYSNWKK